MVSEERLRQKGVLILAGKKKKRTVYRCECLPTHRGDTQKKRINYSHYLKKQKKMEKAQLQVAYFKLNTWAKPICLKTDKQGRKELFKGCGV